MPGRRMLGRRRFLCSLAAGAASLAIGRLPDPARAVETPAGQARPNILFILADDLGWGDVGYHGAPIKTPNIDRLCKTGVELDRHYVQPMCTPTRVALLTGRYPSRFGDQAIKPCAERVLPWGTETLATLLGRQGYDTGLAGKWHLGSRVEWGPSHFGFKRSYGSLAGGCGQYDHLYKKGPFSRTWHREGKLLDEKGHTSDLIAREVVGWIGQKKTPWFYYVPFTAVHIPVEAPDDFIKMYDGEKFDDDLAKDQSYKRYAAFTTHMDDAIGRILAAVDRAGQRENTLVVFASDNGSYPSGSNAGYPGKYPPCPRLGSNKPLRGQKATLYEGGMRVTACVNWPGHLKPAKVAAVMHMVDWMPTLTKLCGCQPRTDLKWDGMDVWPQIAGLAGDVPQRTIYWKFITGKAVLHGDWKLIVHNNTTELFNLADDPVEAVNLAARHPEKVKALQDLMARAARDDSANRPPDPQA